MLKYTYIKALYFPLLVVSVFLYWTKGPVGMWMALALTVLYLAVIVYGSFSIRTNFFLQAFHEAQQRQAVALTFDDGPAFSTLQVLEVLKAHQVKATFFLIGSQVKQYPEIVRQMVAEGHQIGNHTYSHANATGFYSELLLTKEIEETADLVYECTGLKMKLFRPPFGVTSPNLAKVVSRLQLHTIGWSVRSLDTLSRPVDWLVHRVDRRLKPGSIVLFHDNREHTVEALKQLIPKWKSQAVAFTTVGELLNIEAYE